MRSKTQQIFERLNKGSFLSVDSIDADEKHLYDEIEENYAEYEAYFQELGIQLVGGDGYYYFARNQEANQTIEQKLQSFAQWIDILDFLKTYDIAFSTGFHFSATHIIERIKLDLELRDKARKLFRKQNTNQEIIEKLIDELTNIGFAELIDEEDGTYKVTSAFRYAEEMVNLITIFNEEDTSEL